MNLDEIVEEYGSLNFGNSRFLGMSFGSENQLTIIGWLKPETKAKNKYYVVKCTICCQDPELFGEGYFKITKSNITSGRMPCGCAPSPRWSPMQWGVLCKREAKNRGYEFIDFKGDWRGSRTTLRLSCELHGIWDTTNISSFMQGVGCPSCNGGVKKKDSEMISKFMATGSFHPDTVFSRSDKRNHNNLNIYWDVYCPVCNSHSTSTYNNLGQGKKPCFCNKKFTQDKAYVNLLYDSDYIVAIKFGITSEITQRVYRQDYKASYKVVNHAVYRFESPDHARTAEKECKQTLECGIILKRDMPDGWTETTWLYNLDKIIEIYERNGGELVDEWNTIAS